MLKKYIRKFDIKIQSLSNNKHEFIFDFDQSLFQYFSNNEDIKNTLGKCKVEFIKSDIMLNLLFKIEGKTTLICDRTLKPFNYLLKFEKKILFKFSDKEEELSDEMLTINHNKSILNVGKFIYEFFILKIPIKRLHPSLKNEDNIDNFVYTTTKGEKRFDPRLELLKNLKINNGTS